MSKQKKRFTPEEKYSYHQNRVVSPGRLSIKLNVNKQMYSIGFCDGFDGITNKSAVRHDYGNKAAASYDLGHRRGFLESRKRFR